MNTKDEIIDAIEGCYEGELPPPVLFTQTGTVSLMEHCGAYWPDAHRSVEKMVKLALQPSELFGFATARVPYDVSAEAEAVGCYVTPGTDRSQPMVTGSPWRDACGDNLPLPSVDEFLSNERIRTVIDSAAKITDSREDLFVTSMCISASGVVSHMLGMENMIMLTVTDLDYVKGLVDDVMPLSTAYAGELSKISDNVMVIASVLPGIMTPDCISYTAKKDAMLVSAIKNSYSTVHNCGDTFEDLDELVAMSPDVLSLETSSGPERYLKRIGRRCRTLGCLSPINVLLPGTPDSVKAEALRSAELGFDLVGPECGLSPITPDENIMALSRYRD